MALIAVARTRIRFDLRGDCVIHTNMHLAQHVFYGTHRHDSAGSVICNAKGDEPHDGVTSHMLDFAQL